MTQKVNQAYQEHLGVLDDADHAGRVSPATSPVSGSPRRQLTMKFGATRSASSCRGSSPTPTYGTTLNDLMTEFAELNLLQGVPL